MATSNMIYLDNAATTMPDEAVVEAMLPYLRESYANPSAAYSSAARVRKALGHVREQIACLINAEPDEIYFTSGGSESNNTAIKGVAGNNDMSREPGSMITTRIEHPAALRAFEELEKARYSVKYLTPDSCGIVAPDIVADSVKTNTCLVSVMTANNEIGSVNDIAGIGAICRERGIVFHTDAVQAVGHIPVDVASMNIDMLSASGHKFHGPKGVGFLYVKRGTAVRPLINGGGQERGLRSGTENVAAVVGMGVAAEAAGRSMEADARRISTLRDSFAERILNEIPGSIYNGPTDNSRRLPGNVHFAFTGIEGASLLIQLDMRGICASTGSACSASVKGPSRVLSAIGLGSEYINGSIRFTLSKYTTEDELDRTVNILKESVSALRAMRVQ